MLESDEYEIHPEFNNKLENIFQFYQKNQSKFVEYYCQELVQLYGQGIITYVVLGAKLEQYRFSSLSNNENETAFEAGVRYNVRFYLNYRVLILNFRLFFKLLSNSYF